MSYPLTGGRLPKHTFFDPAFSFPVLATGGTDGLFGLLPCYGLREVLWAFPYARLGVIQRGWIYSRMHIHLRRGSQHPLRRLRSTLGAVQEAMANHSPAAECRAPRQKSLSWTLIWEAATRVASRPRENADPFVKSYLAAHLDWRVSTPQDGETLPRDGQ